jgi:cation:H+ antiporter
VTVAVAVGAVAIGLVLLVRAADVFVGAAEGVAVHLRWSPTVIGAIVVGFGTSLPELVTSALAAWAGDAGIALGNAAGSNVANLLLVLGIAVLVVPVQTGRGELGRDLAIAGAAGLLLLGAAVGGQVGPAAGVVLLVALAATVSWQVRVARPGRVEVAARGPLQPLVVRTLGGLVGVIVGAQLLVWGATGAATELGVPSIVVGSVLVAVGTSLPELATAVASARRGQTQLLLGNLFGSNAFNALGVVGVAALLAAARGEPLAVDTAGLAVVGAAAVVTLAVGIVVHRVPRLGRPAGAVLVGAYALGVPLLTAIS